MESFQLNKQIALLRKRKGITQEELAQALGVTNQTISKWESALCCPDIQLLPDIASYFGVSIDELMGYKSINSYSDIYQNIRALFEASPKEEAFTIAFKLSALLHEGACTRGYKGYVPWDTSKDLIEKEDCYKWGSSICSEPEGITVHKGNSVFISDNKGAQGINNTKVGEVYSTIESLCDRNTLKVLFGLYELTMYDYDLYVPIDVLIEKYKLSEENIKNALYNIPVQIKETQEGQLLYRIEGSYMHIPSLLLMLITK